MTTWALRWRTEITMLVIAVVVSQALAAGASHKATLVRALITASVIMAQRETRGWVVDHAHCLLTRHRLYDALEEVQAEFGAGPLPLVLRVKPCAAGEQAFLWRRGEITGAVLYNRANQLAAACWAKEVRVFLSPRWASLMIIEVVRREEQPPDTHAAAESKDYAGASASRQ
jgi:hypothetical protein